MTAKFAKLGLVYERNDKPSFCFITILETIQKVTIYDYKFANELYERLFEFSRKKSIFSISIWANFGGKFIIQITSDRNRIDSTLETTLQKNYRGCELILKFLNFPHFLTGKRNGEKVWEIQIF